MRLNASSISISTSFRSGRGDAYDHYHNCENIRYLWNRGAWCSLKEYLANISGPVHSVHSSFMWFMCFEWHKSTFYPVTDPDDFQNVDLLWCRRHTVYPKKYAHGFVVLCFVVVMQSFIMNSHEVFIHIHQGCFAGTGAIVRLPQCQWSKPDGYGKISQCITTTKHSKAKSVRIFLGIYCINPPLVIETSHWPIVLMGFLWTLPYHTGISVSD